MPKIVENFPNLANPTKFVQKCLRHNLQQVRKKCDTFLKNHSFPPISQVTHKKNEVHFYFSKKCVSSKKMCVKSSSRPETLKIIEKTQFLTIFDKFCNFGQILQNRGKFPGNFPGKSKNFPGNFPEIVNFDPRKLVVLEAILGF